MNNPIGQAVIFFAGTAIVGFAIGVYAVGRGSVILGGVSFVGAAIAIWCVIDGVRNLRLGPPPKDDEL